MDEPLFHTMPDGRRIAFRLTPGKGPTLLFLPGYMSDMAGTKATALAEWAFAAGRACLRFDYSGCGESEGDFAQGTLTRWRDEALALVARSVDGPVVIVGSSMGGWLMLLVARELGERVCGMVGIAAAPDFTDWGFDTARKAILGRGETVFEPNPYGPEPTPTHPAFFADGQASRVLGTAIEIDCPVHLLHGQRDAEVPFDVSLRLAAALRSDAVKVTLVKDGDHRLSRPQDIALLQRVVAEITDTE